MFDTSSDPRMRSWLPRAALAVLVILGLYLLGLALGAFANLRYVGAGVQPTNTISVQGTGEVFAKPDLASFDFSVVESAKTTAEAQEAATKKANEAIAYLKAQKIDEKDIKTLSYSIYPKYEYSTVQCFAYPCPGGKQNLVGYEVNQTIEVKVRDTSKVGELLSGVGKLNVSNVTGVNFTLDDEEAVKNEARSKAIAQAKARADELARELGVHIVRVVSFSDNNYPIYYSKAYAADGRGGVANESAPQVPSGENQFTSNVTITYEIR